MLAPTYLSVSWVLTVSYQLFTDTAVKSIAAFANMSFPTAGAWLNANLQAIGFVIAFTWIFVLSSVIPSVILGKQRSVIIQYAVVLILTLISFFMGDILRVAAGIQIETLFTAANLLRNPFVAGLYLSMPYLFMFVLDVRARRQQKAEEKAQVRRLLSHNY